MAVPTMDFDWLLDHASAIAFDPGRPSIYVFGLDMTPQELQEQVLSPMEQHDLFAVAQTKFIDDNQRGRYKGQLPRVGLTLFEVNGHQCGIVLSYHSKFEPNLAQYEAWQTLLAATFTGGGTSQGIALAPGRWWLVAAGAGWCGGWRWKVLSDGDFDDAGTVHCQCLHDGIGDLIRA